MSIKKVISIILFFFCITIFSQNKKLDSLQTVLENHIKNDIAKVNLTQRIVKKLYKIDVQKAELLLKDSKKLADSLQYEYGIATSFFLQAKIFKSKSDFKNAYKYYTKSLKIYTKLNKIDDVIKATINIGNTYYFRGNYEESLQLYNKALDLSKTNNKEQLTAISNEKIANYYYIKGKYDKAIKIYKENIVIYKSYNNNIGIANINNNLGGVYLGLNNYELALEHFQVSLEIYEKLNYKKNIASKLRNIGSIYYYQKDYEKALVYFNKALILSKELNNKYAIASSLSTISLINNDKGNKKKAIKTINEALTIQREINNKPEIANSLFNLAYYLFDEDIETAKKHFEESLVLFKEMDVSDGIALNYIGLANYNKKKENFKQALIYAKQALKISEKLSSNDLTQEVSLVLSEVYEQTKDYKKSLHYYKNFKTITDTIFNEENIRKIANIEYKYKYKNQLETAHKRENDLAKEITIKNLNIEKSKRQKLWTLIGFLVLTIALGFTIYQLKIKDYKAKNQQIKTEQKLLRSQMTPHFIFNSLSVLQGIILNKEYKKAIVFLSKFSKLLRAILDNSYNKSVSLKDELEALDNYIAIQNLSLENIFNYQINVTKHIDEEKILVPPMIIQPFVENAIIHGKKENQSDFNLLVAVVFNNNVLTCTITDNGIGINSHKSKNIDKNESLATKITSKRLELISKEFNGRAGITIKDRSSTNANGTIVTLTLPFKLI